MESATRNLATLIIFFLSTTLHISAFEYKQYQYDKMYFCTATCKKYYNQAVNLIGSIHKYSFNELGEIAVFNLGMTKDQVANLNSMQKVKVFEVEKVHPDILKPIATRSNGRKKVPGWYAFQPVVVKQALDMYPYVIYIDSGAVVLTKIDDYFKHIVQNDYFLVSCDHDIRWMTTEYLVKKFELDSEELKWILNKDTCGCAGGLVGVTRNMYNSFILPLYELARDLRNFMDDGTTPNGFGTARHSQTLYSIQARLLGLNIIEERYSGNLSFDGKTVPTGIVEKRSDIKKDSKIFHCRTMGASNNKKNIRYRS